MLQKTFSLLNSKWQNDTYDEYNWKILGNKEQSITLTSMVISICTIILNPKIQKIEVSEDMLAPKIVKNMVSFIFFS